jgi:hypothetical protein
MLRGCTDVIAGYGPITQIGLISAKRRQAIDANHANATGATWPFA